MLTVAVLATAFRSIVFIALVSVVAPIVALLFARRLAVVALYCSIDIYTLSTDAGTFLFLLALVGILTACMRFACSILSCLLTLFLAKLWKNL